MTEVVLGVAGAAVGSFFGIPPSVGYSLGSALGGAIGPKQKQVVDGTRLTDLSVQTSTYAQIVTEINGNARAAGNLIWATDLIEEEVVTSQDVGGKGGGSTIEQHDWLYYANIAVLIARGPIAGVLKIWADSKVIYNVSTSDQDTLDASAELPVRIYRGTETQNPDPLIESYIGVNNTPAYRGFAYAVFEKWLLTPYGNRIPNLTFEARA